MKHLAEHNHLQVSGVQEQGTFRIKASGKAFRVLIDGLYSNKIGAVVREITANAYDSHIAAGVSEKPFYVHCPSILKPEFFVRDYGIGMSHETVMNLYSTLFESDKDDTNDLVGQFGLGSKSPFAYTDQFCVSCFSGIDVRHYVAAIGEQGIPQIILMKTEDSAEHRGVRISFGTNEKDIIEFKQAIQNVSLGFDNPFESNIPVTSLPTPVLTGPGWKMYRQISNLNSPFSVKQGCVIYPIMSSALLKLPDDYDYRRFVIDAPIGTVEVTSSREAISYSPAVVAYLNQRIEALKEEFPDCLADALSKIENVKDYFDEVERLSPVWDETVYIHPATQLRCEEITLGPNQFEMEVIYKAHYSKNWQFHKMERSSCLSSKDKRTIYRLADYAAMLDTAREPDEEFSKREDRRMKRLFKLWAEEKGVNKATFWLGVDLPASVLKYGFGSAQFVDITPEDLFANAAPKRRRKIKSIVRGIVQMTLPDTRQRSVTEITENPGKCAWISSVQYSDATAYRANQIAAHYGVEDFYIVNSTSTKRMENTKVPRLRDVIDVALKKQFGLGWDDYVTFIGVIDPNTYNLVFFRFLKRLKEASPDELRKICKLRNPVGRFAALLSPFLDETHFTEARRKRTPANLPELIHILDRPGTEKRVLRKDIEELQKLSAAFSENYHSPANSYVNALSSARTDQQLLAASQGLIALSRLPVFTTPLKWTHYYD